MLGVNIEPYFSIKRRVLIYFKFWESIVHHIFVPNFGYQYGTIFLNQTLGVHIDAAAVAATAAAASQRQQQQFDGYWDF